MRPLILIPARYDSSRFPGKPLIDILGQSLIYRVWRQCVRFANWRNVYVVTDDERIKKHCQEHCIQYVMTSKDCLTGTDRIAEAYEKIGENYETIINVQGDEPLIDPKDILKIANKHSLNKFDVYCGMSKITSEEEFKSPNTIKVVTNFENNLLYASRAGIPTDKKLRFHSAYKQVCIYAFSSWSLNWFHSNCKSDLEKIEDIEILRFLENDECKVKMVEVSNSSISVDVPEDVKRVEEIIRINNDK